MNPEFLREGLAVEDFLHPDRIVIGSRDEYSGDSVAAVYRGLSAPVVRCGLTAAEMIKYASNALLATKISFANEVGNVCKRLGIDVYEVMEGVGMDHRVSPHFLSAGAGFGGAASQKTSRPSSASRKDSGKSPHSSGRCSTSTTASRCAWCGCSRRRSAIFRGSGSPSSASPSRTTPTTSGSPGRHLRRSIVPGQPGHSRDDHMHGPGQLTRDREELRPGCLPGQAHP